MKNNRIGSVMVGVLDSSAVNWDSNPCLVKPRTMKLVFAASPWSTQH